MTQKRFILNSSSRSSTQGTLINVGKESEEYRALTNSMTMAAADMAEIGHAEGQRALVRTPFGEAEFQCPAGKVPLGMIFVPYGPPTCKLMGEIPTVPACRPRRGGKWKWCRNNP